MMGGSQVLNKLMLCLHKYRQKKTPCKRSDHGTMADQHADGLNGIVEIQYIYNVYAILAAGDFDCKDRTLKWVMLWRDINSLAVRKLCLPQSV